MALRFLASMMPSVRLLVIGLYDNDVNKWPHLSFSGAVKSFQNTGFAVKSTCGQNGHCDYENDVRFETFIATTYTGGSLRQRTDGYPNGTPENRNAAAGITESAFYKFVLITKFRQIFKYVSVGVDETFPPPTVPFKNAPGNT